MILGDQQNDRLRRTRAIFDPRMRRRIVSKSNVGTALRDLDDDDLDWQHADSNVQLWILRAERGEYFINQRVDVALAQSQLNMALLKASQRLKPVLELLLMRSVRDLVSLMR